MSNGKRYSKEGKKLNIKKVFGVIIAIAVIIMVIISIEKLLEPKKESEQLTASTYYFAAYKNGKWGVIDGLGEEVIPFNYEEMITVPDKTKDVFITVTDVNLETGSYKTVAFNKKREKIFGEYEQVEPIDNYDDAQNLWYEENALRIQKDGKYGLINFKGAKILDTKYDEIYSLKGVKNSLIIKTGEKIGLVSNSGDIIVPVEYKEIKAFGNDYSNGYIVTNEDGKQGVIGCNKKVILDVNYEEIKNVTGNSMYAVKENGNIKIINSQKETVFDGEFDDLIQIDGENIVLKRGGSFGVVTTSEEKIPFNYEYIKSIGNNYFIAKKDGKYGVIDGSNNETIEFKYEYIKQRKDTDFVEADESATKTDIYSKDMKLKITGIVSKVDVEKGYICVRVGENQKYYNFKFEEKTEKDFFPNHTLFLAKQNGKYGYKDKNGNVIVDYIYDDAKEQNEYGFCSVKKGTVWGSLNKDGNVSYKPCVNLDDSIIIDFIGKWHLAEDLNLNYYEM